MKRFAFKMFLKPGCEEEYERRHAAIWPELKQMIKDQGVSDYSIFWDKETNILFAVQKCNKETNSQDTENVDPITQRWWDMMADIMEVNPDNSPVSHSKSCSTWTDVDINTTKINLFLMDRSDTEISEKTTCPTRCHVNAKPLVGHVVYLSSCPVTWMMV